MKKKFETLISREEIAKRVKEELGAKFESLLGMRQSMCFVF